MCVFFNDSVHGLVRGENMELGRDSDTGGQVYVMFIDLKFKSVLANRFFFCS